ncbi:ATP-binding protein [Dyadobacter sp. CY399]|uniref:ATP-binding protein n=2 Tax=Dyadobacter fanqingshengii TaxID=2906443 RepID=A0A9X1PAL0_9BACT|nr:sensor histidine kinase [Dyadobacter fanqingshengii]MCF0039900.1 ATP-binding protein [Dyadobacter fanqingshengii]
MLRRLLRFELNLSCIISRSYRLIPFLLLICLNMSYGQAPQTRVNIQLLGPEQGLPSRNTRSLAQDGRGFMWVATGQELWRYDGYTFQNFTAMLTRSLGGGTLINQIRTGPNGAIWVAHNSGVSIVDPLDLTCKTINPSKPFKNIDSKQHLDVFFDKDQNGWVSVPRGKLIKINKNFVPVALYTPPADAGNAAAVGSQITKMFVDGKDRLYAFSDSTYLDEINEKANLINRTNLLAKDMDPRRFSVFNVVQSGADTLQIYYKHNISKKFLMRQYALGTRIFSPLTDIDTPIAADVIYAYKNNYKWYKSSKEIGLLNQKTGQFTNLTTRLLQKSGADIFFFGACLSTDGSFWAAGVDGLIKVTLTEEIFRRYMSVPLEKTGDIGSSVRGITEDNSGMIWACSYGYNRDGLQYLLHQIDPLTHLSRHMQLHSKANVSNEMVIPYKVLFTKDEVYAVTDGIQFLKIDPETEAYHAVAFPFVSGRGFTSFYKLNDSTFWAGTWGGMGIIGTRDLKPVLLNDKAGRYIKNERINNFMPWNQNRILVSTTNGLYVLNQDASIYEHYGQTAGDKIKLPALQIFHTAWFENALWAATGQGLIRIDVNNKTTQLFTTHDGLPDNNIYAALPDERGNLWLSTNKGLSRFDTRTKKFHNYGISDGLPHLEFNHGSYLKSRNGTLYFGGLNGVVAFNPEKLDLSSKKESGLQLISYSKFDAGRNKADTITTHQAGQQIIFNPGDRLFAFAFMSPDYQNTSLNRFRYKLEGWGDDRWQMFENGNKLLFNSLPPGNYMLKVQVSVGGADWSSQEWQSPVRVLTPWYKSVWFFVLSLLFIGILIYLFYQYRLRQIMDIQKIRNGISADMHDEIGSTLSSITFYSQALLMQIEKTEHQQVVQKIKENAQQVQEGLSDIVWSVKAGSDQIEDVFARMFQFGSTLAESKGFDFRFESDSQLQNLKLDMQTRKNLYLIFKEAMNNAAKYSNANTVEVYTTRESGRTKLTINDNGRGFDPGFIKKGNGLTNMHQRAAQMNGVLTIHSAIDEGTTITLLF